MSWTPPGFRVGQPCRGQGNGSERWISKPLPYGYDDQNNAARLQNTDGVFEQQHARDSGPIKIIRKTEFQYQAGGADHQDRGRQHAPALGKQDATDLKRECLSRGAGCGAAR